MNWTELTSDKVQNVLNVVKDETILPKVAFMALEDFLEKADEESLYHLMVQIRVQLSFDIDNEKFARRLDTIANYGTQSKIYLTSMQKAFVYIEKEGKPLPTPPT